MELYGYFYLKKYFKILFCKIKNSHFSIHFKQDFAHLHTNSHLKSTKNLSQLSQFKNTTYTTMLDSNI